MLILEIPHRMDVTIAEQIVINGVYLGMKDLNRVKAILGKIKSLSSSFHEKVIKHPVFAQILATIVTNQIGLS